MSRPSGQLTDTEPLLQWEWDLIKPHLEYHWQLVFEVLWETGARLGEALALTKKDLENNGVWVTSEKREDHLRMHIPLSTGLYNRLSLYALQHKSAKLFPYSPSAAWLALKKACKEAGVRQTIHPHSFRHGFGYRAMKANPGRQQGALEQLKAVQKMLRHTSPRHTERYVDLPQCEINEAFKKLNP